MREQELEAIRVSYVEDDTLIPNVLHRGSQESIDTYGDPTGFSSPMKVTKQPP